MFRTEKEVGQTPDKWVILKYFKKDEVVFSVFGGWGGGYLHGPSWKRSSAIKNVERQDGKFIAETESGSTYNLRDSGIGYTGQTASMAKSIKETTVESDYEILFLEDIEAVEEAFVKIRGKPGR